MPLISQQPNIMMHRAHPALSVLARAQLEARQLACSRVVAPSFSGTARILERCVTTSAWQPQASGWQSTPAAGPSGVGFATLAPGLRPAGTPDWSQQSSSSSSSSSSGSSGGGGGGSRATILNPRDDPRWLRDHLYNHTWAPGGLPAAAQALPLHWRNATAGPAATELPPALSTAALGGLPVLLVDANNLLPPDRNIWLTDGVEKRFGANLSRAAYTEEHLSQQGLLRVRQSCAIVERRSGTVLGLFLTGNEYPDLLEATANHRRLHAQLCEVYGGATLTPRNDNSTITMHGLRWPARWKDMCPADPQTGHRSLCFGYYRARSASSAARLEADPELRHSIISTSSAICALERKYAPAMAAYRLAVAKQQGLPGILPGVPPEVCSTSMIGSSLGYISAPHRDGHKGMPPMPGLSETISYRGAKACFGLLKGGVLLDLSASEACIVMVPADDMHGTLPPPSGVVNDGIGVVIAAAKHLEACPAAMAHKEEFIRRAAARQAELAARLAQGPQQQDRWTAATQQGQQPGKATAGIPGRESLGMARLGPVAMAFITGGTAALAVAARKAAVQAATLNASSTSRAGSHVSHGSHGMTAMQVEHSDAADGCQAAQQHTVARHGQLVTNDGATVARAAAPLMDNKGLLVPVAAELLEAPLDFDWGSVGGSFWQSGPLYGLMNRPT